ncbi:MAG: acetoin utilization protein AcuC [Nitrososphaerales archaeon]
MCSVGIMYGDALTKYGFGSSHPLGSDRLGAFWSKFQAEGFDKAQNIVIEGPVMAEEDALLNFHSKTYVEFVKKASEFGHGFLDYGDTPAYKGVFEAGSYVVGSTLKALDMVMNGKVDHAFNPIGGLHHARRESAAGFCVFNDIGIAIVAARSYYNVRKIAYVDIDAHHGDGVFYEFNKDPDLFIVDVHEDGKYLYPGTGFEYETGDEGAEGTKLNLPMKPHADDGEFINAFMRAEEFLADTEPELIIMQCGGDCIKGDPLTHLNFSKNVHIHATNFLHKLAHRHCSGKMVALGGGGYNRNNIAMAWVEVVRTFSNSISHL